MLTDTLPSGLTLPKIGYGMWKIGGAMAADRSKDERSLQAVRTALEIGYTHFDTAEMYARGHSEALLAQALHDTGTPRENVFITTKVSPSNLRHDDLIGACEASLARLDTEYIDLYLIHWPGRTPLEESFRALNTLQAAGKIRHIGVSNFDLRLLERAITLCDTPLATNQIQYSLSDRAAETGGMVEFCRENGLFVTAYSPVDAGRLRVLKPLREVAAKHNATAYQIALAWLVRQPNVITIPMSMNPTHIAENFAAADIRL
ncbi:MAG TPA: aldo/keto reductase, partial [Anaerolineales bacterium]|nr:aldo/keto reductase [Anaerolineales bacterium]